MHVPDQVGGDGSATLDGLKLDRGTCGMSTKVSFDISMISVKEVYQHVRFGGDRIGRSGRIV